VVTLKAAVFDVAGTCSADAGADDNAPAAVASTNAIAHRRRRVVDVLYVTKAILD
jgi:hypothetical protein